MDCGDNREIDTDVSEVLWFVMRACCSDHGVWPTDTSVVLVNMPLYCIQSERACVNFLSFSVYDRN